MRRRVLASGPKSCGGNNKTKRAKNVTYFRRSDLIRLICTTFKLPILIWNCFFFQFLSLLTQFRPRIDRLNGKVIKCKLLVTDSHTVSCTYKMCM